MDTERRHMPNGRRAHDDTSYNVDWCKDKHTKLDDRMDKLDSRMWTILVMLFVNLGGIVGILMTVLFNSNSGAA